MSFEIDFFFRQFHALSISFKRSKFKANLIHVMDFASVELFSVTCLGLELIRKCKTQKTWKQTVKQLPRQQGFTYHMIWTPWIHHGHSLNHVNEANSVWNSLKKRSIFKGCIGINSNLFIVLSEKFMAKQVLTPIHL